MHNDRRTVPAPRGAAAGFGARRRLPSGTHVPHPGIRYTRTRAEQVDFERPTPIWLDGRRTGTAKRLSVRLEVGALLIVV